MPAKARFNSADVPTIQRMLDNGMSNRAIARFYSCDHGTVDNFVRKHGLIRPARRLLVIDIETMANLAWVWGVYDQTIHPVQIVQHKRTISFAAKWVGEPKVIFRSEHEHGRSYMIRHAWDLLDEADAVIGYNSKRFDTKHLNTEFKLEGLGPPSHYQHIDLLTVGRREFAFSSNKLESVADRLGIGKKREHEGFALWLKCEAGDKDAWARMEDYNRTDTLLTEKLFNEFRDWIPLRGSQSNKKIKELLAA